MVTLICGKKRSDYKVRLRDKKASKKRVDRLDPRNRLGNGRGFVRRT